MTHNTPDDDLQELPLLNSIDDFMSEWAVVLMEDLKITPQELAGLYTELYAKSRIDPSLLATITDTREYLGVNESNWEYWVRRIATAASINSELGQRGPFRVDMGTTIYTEPNVFGVQGLDHYVVFFGSAEIIKKTMRVTDELCGIVSEEERAKQYEQLERGARELDKMAACRFECLLKEIVGRYHDPDIL